MLKYVKALAHAAALVVGYLLLQLVITAVFAAIGGMGKADILAGMEEYILDNTHLISAIWEVSLMALIALFFERRKPRREALRLYPVKRDALLFSAALGASAAIVISAGVAFLPIPEEVMSDYAHQLSLGADESPLIQLLYTLLLAPAAEEFAFRLAVYGVLRRAFGAPVSAALSSIAFGMMHVSPLWAAYAAAAGLMLCAVYELTSSLFAPVLCHMAFNVFGMVIAPLSITNGVTAAIEAAIAVAAAIYCVRRLMGAARNTNTGG